jgi:hypothetical protein
MSCSRNQFFLNVDASSGATSIFIWRKCFCLQASINKDGQAVVLLRCNPITHHHHHLLSIARLKQLRVLADAEVCHFVSSGIWGGGGGSCGSKRWTLLGNKPCLPTLSRFQLLNRNSLKATLWYIFWHSFCDGLDDQGIEVRSLSGKEIYFPQR